MVKNKYTIIRDTREQDGWDFNSEEKGVKMVSRKLDTGDYTIEGYEDILCIERKATPSEVATNIGKDKIRFNKEIERMRAYTHAFIICEFSFNDMVIYPEGSRLSKLQKSRIKIRGPYILKTLTEYQVDYDIKIIYAGSPYGAKLAAESIFKRVLNVR